MLKKTYIFLTSVHCSPVAPLTWFPVCLRECVLTPCSQEHSSLNSCFHVSHHPASVVDKEAEKTELSSLSPRSGHTQFVSVTS